MRVTKVIREYIEERVNEKYPMPEQKETVAEFALKELEERCKTFIKAEAEAYAKTFVEDFQQIRWRGAEDCNEQKIKSFIENSYVSICKPTFKATAEYREAVEATHEKRRKAVRDIIVELELGATKADLEALLTKLPD